MIEMSNKSTHDERLDDGLKSIRSLGFLGRLVLSNLENVSTLFQPRANEERPVEIAHDYGHGEFYDTVRTCMKYVFAHGDRETQDGTTSFQLLSNVISENPEVVTFLLTSPQLSQQQKIGLRLLSDAIKQD